MITKTPLNSLKLFPELNRDSYQKLTGTQAPLYNPALQIKPWLDPSALGGDPAATMAYTYFDATAGMLATMTLARSVAAVVNLPGAFTYPVYTIAPTVATIVNGMTGAATGINAAYICEEKDARALAAELGGSVIQTPQSGWPYRDEWSTETRRQWLVVVNGATRNAAQLIAQKNRQGVGAPGHWVIGQGEPTWVTEIPTAEVKDLRPWVPTPIRSLQPDERLEVTPFGAYVLTGTEDAPAAGGSFTDDDRATLKAIAQKVGA